MAAFQEHLDDEMRVRGRCRHCGADTQVCLEEGTCTPCTRLREERDLEEDAYRDTL